MRLSVLGVVCVTLTFDLSDGVSVTQREPSVTKSEGEAATLTCTYSTDGYYLYWYRQYPGKQLEFAVRRHTNGRVEYQAEFAKSRFSDTVRQSDKMYRLTISELLLSDTAVYYCAVRLGSYPYDYTEKLTFGSGTQLTVVPKDQPQKNPTLSVFYPPAIPIGGGGSVDTAAVCLVSEFFPKDFEFFLKTTTNEKNNFTGSSHLLNNGLYRSSGFLSFNRNEQSVNVTCEARDNKDSPVASDARQSGAVTVEQPVCEKRSNDSTVGLKDTQKDLPRANFLSLTVLGLRVLFFKSVAFNVLLTARVWLF